MAARLAPMPTKTVRFSIRLTCVAPSWLTPRHAYVILPEAENYALHIF
jgi:hypothetical protein